VTEPARSVPRPTEIVDRFLRAMVSPDPGEMADCYAEHVVIEMPFSAASLAPGRIETGRDELRARFRAGRAARAYSRVDHVIVHETADPEVVIVEYDLHGELRPDGTPFVQSFLLIMTIRDGAIVHSRDYTNPITGARLLGRVPELVAELTGAGAP
jgi:uncharacterized protein